MCVSMYLIVLSFYMSADSTHRAQARHLRLKLVVRHLAEHVEIGCVRAAHKRCAVAAAE